jgi:hypothetical protein
MSEVATCSACFAYFPHRAPHDRRVTGETKQQTFPESERPVLTLGQCLAGCVSASSRCLAGPILGYISTFADDLHGRVQHP